MRREVAASSCHVLVRGRPPPTKPFPRVQTRAMFPPVEKKSLGPARGRLREGANLPPDQSRPPNPFCIQPSRVVAGVVKEDLTPRRAIVFFKHCCCREASFDPGKSVAPPKGRFLFPPPVLRNRPPENENHQKICERSPFSLYTPRNVFSFLRTTAR